MSEKRSSSLLRRSLRDEGGAVLVIAAVGVVVALICASLAIDLGFVAADKRTDQKIADLAALDASRDLPGVTANCSAPPTASGALCPAVVSATRNFTGKDAPLTVSAERMSLNGSGGYLVDPVGTFVRVTVTSPRKPFFPFVGTNARTVTAAAVAGPGNAIGTVRVGSKIASLSGSTSALQVLMLNKTISSLIGGSYSTDLVGWQGLVSGNVTFGALTSQLATLTGNSTFAVGTPSQILQQTFTMGQLLTATSNVLKNDGTAGDVSIGNSVQTIGTKVDGTYLNLPIKLYDLFNFGSVVIGNKQDVANTSLNVLELIRGGAILADGSHLASFNLTAADINSVISPLSLPGAFDNVKISMGLIEAPQESYPGPAGKDSSGNYYTFADTSQIRVKIDVTIKIAISAITQTISVVTTTLVPAGTLVNATMSYYLSAGSAHAYLDAIHCGTGAEPLSVDILGVTDVGMSRLGLVTDTELKTKATVPVPGPQPVLSILGILNVTSQAVNTGPTISGNPGQMLTFNPPYTASSPSQPISGTTLSLPSLANANLSVSPLLASLNTGTLVSDLVSGFNSTGLTFSTTTPGLTTSILKPLYDALGLSFGGADIWAPPPQTCAGLSPLGPLVSGGPPVLRG